MTVLAPGETIETSSPADVGGSYEAFQYRTLLQISSALGIPYAYLSNDMLRANYSNAGLALLEFRRRIEAWQHAVMVYQLCRPAGAEILQIKAGLMSRSQALAERGFDAEAVDAEIAADQAREKRLGLSLGAVPEGKSTRP